MQSRYYNPEWGRFLNADALVSTGGLLGNNVYSYCWNNPVRYYDDLGRAPVETNLSDDAIDDLMDQNEVGGFATAPNSIDLGYTYHVNLFQAANSSVWGGGVYLMGIRRMNIILILIQQQASPSHPDSPQINRRYSI